MLNQQYFKTMTSVNTSNSNIIEIDDDDNKQALNIQKTPLPTPGIHPTAFPKLFHLLQKRNELKLKADQEKKNQQVIQPLPEVIKPSGNDAEVFQVVPMAPSYAQILEQKQTEDNKEVNEREINSNKEEDPAENNTLAVQQATEPLIPFCPQVQPIATEQQQQQPPKQVQEPQAQNEEKANAEAPNEQVMECPIQNEALTNREPNQSHLQAVEPQQCISEMFSASQRIQKEPEQLISKPVETEIPQEREPVSLQHSPPSSSKTMQVLLFGKIKEFLTNLLPQMVTAIGEMSHSDLLDIFNKVKEEISQSQLQKLFSDKSQRPKNHTNPPQAQQNHSASQYDPSWTELQILRHMTTLPFEDLKTQMKKYFEDLNYPFEVLPFSELRDIVNQAIRILEKQKVAQSIPQTNNNPQIPQQTSFSEPIIQQQNQPSESIPETIPSLPIKEITMAEMKQFLIDNIPSINGQRLQAISDDYIKKLYDGAKHGLFSRSEISQKINSYSPSILGLCSQKFPHLENQISKITEQEVNAVLETITNAAHEPSKKPEQRKRLHSSMNLPNEGSQKSVIVLRDQSPELNQKRTHEMMMASNPRKSQQNKAEQKKRNASELRAKLLLKLPDLRENIMKLDDNEIEKIYRDSVQKKQPTSSVRKPNKESEARPVILMKETKPAEVFKSNEMRQDDKSKAITKESIENGKESGRLERKKKTRTIIFVHTEELSDDEVEGGLKMRKTQTGLQKKSSCECFQNASMSELLKKLAELVEKKG